VDQFTYVNPWSKQSGAPVSMSLLAPKTQFQYFYMILLPFLCFLTCGSHKFWSNPFGLTSSNTLPWGLVMEGDQFKLKGPGVRTTSGPVSMFFLQNAITHFNSATAGDVDIYQKQSFF
jgi:hypothetical protein